MNERSFQMRLHCRYQDPENIVAELHVEFLADGEWISFDLHPLTPGFLIFTYSIFTCQHLFMRMNCAERGLILDSAEGSIELITSEKWDMQKLHIRFDGKLKGGAPTELDIDEIIRHMGHCPVSRNIQEPPESCTELYLN
jgi:hypothetical protein